MVMLYAASFLHGRAGLSRPARGWCRGYWTNRSSRPNQHTGFCRPLGGHCLFSLQLKLSSCSSNRVARPATSAVHLMLSMSLQGLCALPDMEDCAGRWRHRECLEGAPQHSWYQYWQASGLAGDAFNSTSYSRGRKAFLALAPAASVRAAAACSRTCLSPFHTSTISKQQQYP